MLTCYQILGVPADESDDVTIRQHYESRLKRLYEQYLISDAKENVKLEIDTLRYAFFQVKSEDFRFTHAILNSIHENFVGQDYWVFSAQQRVKLDEKHILRRLKRFVSSQSLFNFMIVRALEQTPEAYLEQVPLINVNVDVEVSITVNAIEQGLRHPSENNLRCTVPFSFAEVKNLPLRYFESLFEKVPSDVIEQLFPIIMEELSLIDLNKCTVDMGKERILITDIQYSYSKQQRILKYYESRFAKQKTKLIRNYVNSTEIYECAIGDVSYQLKPRDNSFTTTYCACQFIKYQYLDQDYWVFVNLYTGFMCGQYPVSKKKSSIGKYQLRM